LTELREVVLFTALRGQREALAGNELRLAADEGAEPRPGPSRS
jgi:hypothetical protein